MRVLVRNDGTIKKGGLLSYLPSNSEVAADRRDRARSLRRSAWRCTKRYGPGLSASTCATIDPKPGHGPRNHEGGVH
jgi:hypothetical protein